jgi:surface protein
MFCECNSLESLPDISEWNTSNVADMRNMFYGCNKLKKLPDISKWKTYNLTNKSGIIDECKLLKVNENVSQWIKSLNSYYIDLFSNSYKFILINNLLLLIKYNFI